MKKKEIVANVSQMMDLDVSLSIDAEMHAVKAELMRCLAMALRMKRMGHGRYADRWIRAMTRAMEAYEEAMGENNDSAKDGSKKRADR